MTKSTGNPVGRPASLQTLAARAAEAAIKVMQEGTKPGTVAPKARYDAAGRGRRMAGWNAPSSGPNLATAGLQTIRNRARDTARNDWTGKSGSQKWSTALVGVGIIPRFPRIESPERRKAVTDIFNDFVKQADADCVLNFYGLQTLVVRTWLMAGECFIRRRNRFLDEGLRVPMQIQVLEPEMVPCDFYAKTWPGLSPNNEIRAGIEFNKRGKRIAYWVYKENPGDSALAGSIGSTDLVRVAASEMCHVVEVERAGQLRGVSQFAPILARLRNIENYDDNTLTRQQLANMVVGFITRGLPTAGVGEPDIDPLTNQPTETDSIGTPLLGMQPGLLQELEDGQKVEWSNPPEAGTEYSAYMRTQHMGTAAGVGIPYELFSGDIANVSDRTLRVLINDFRRFAEQRQWQHVIFQFCQPVIEWCSQAMLLAGHINAVEQEAMVRCEHAPHGWAHIHPTQDPQGKLIEVNAGFRSRASVVGDRGDDPEAVDEERKVDKDREARLGLTPPVTKGA